MPSNIKMHADEIEITNDTVQKLIAEQFPQYAGMSLQRVKSTGTVNAIYRLGDDYCVRLPRLHWADEALKREWDVLPVIAENVTFAVPEIIEKGTPNAGYPLNWAIYKWIHGNAYESSRADEKETAEALARFIHEMRSITIPDNAPKAGRKPLSELDEATVKAIKDCEGDIDAEKALAVWHELLDTEPWNASPVWIHADLLKPNLIVNDGKLSAIIDFGSAGVGDPAFDIIPAWTVLTSKTRESFRSLLQIDDSAWRRAKAYALHQAALIIPYYRESNLEFVNQAKDTISNIMKI